MEWKELRDQLFNLHTKKPPYSLKQRLVALIWPMCINYFVRLTFSPDLWKNYAKRWEKGGLIEILLAELAVLLIVQHLLLMYLNWLRKEQEEAI